MSDSLAGFGDLVFAKVDGTVRLDEQQFDHLRVEIERYQQSLDVICDDKSEGPTQPEFSVCVGADDELRSRLVEIKVAADAIERDCAKHNQIPWSFPTPLASYMPVAISRSRPSHSSCA